jgi:hypothetical protein
LFLVVAVRVRIHVVVMMMEKRENAGGRVEVVDMVLEGGRGCQ